MDRLSWNERKKSIERRYGPGEFEVLRWQIVKARGNGQAKPVAGVEPADSEKEAVEKVALLPGNRYEFRMERIRAGGPQTEEREKKTTPALNGKASPALLLSDSPTRKMFSALEIAYAHFNERLFEPEAWRGDAGNLCELSMTPISTARGPEEYYATLVHEMAHFLDHVRGVKPTVGNSVLEIPRATLGQHRFARAQKRARREKFEPVFHLSKKSLL